MHEAEVAGAIVERCVVSSAQIDGILTSLITIISTALIIWSRRLQQTR